MNQQSPFIVEDRSNLVMGIVGGLIAAVIGACAWAAITVTTGYKLGLAAVGVGFLVGMAVRFLGRGTAAPFRIVGALMALLGCVAGNLFIGVADMTQQSGATYLQTLAMLTPGIALNDLVRNANPMDLLFYAIAVYEGFKLSTVPTAAA